ncbi:MAG TPA: M48 family metalloprotease [Pyrinomonadaceae bacterium]|jgi:Zn-dependent protease with chaperone function
MYYLLAITLALALLLVLNVLVSLLASVVWRIFSPLVQNWSARRRAQVIFALRIQPLAGTLVFIAAFLLPAYFLFEPHETDEVVSTKLAVLASISAVGIALACRRVWKTMSATNRLVADWLAGGEALKLPNVSIPVYIIKHSFPVFAIVGTFRPRMFVTRQVLESLDESEIEAAITHESGHLAARDNFKRILLRICRDLLIVPCGEKLDRAWSENVEAAADEYAARAGGRQTALNLASALVKIARMVPVGSKPALPASAFLIDGQSRDVTWRVRRLLEIAGSAEFFEKRERFSQGFPLWVYSGLISIFILFLATDHSFLQKIHFYMELIVAFV